jgi:hypothetical protein
LFRGEERLAGWYLKMVFAPETVVLVPCAVLLSPTVTSVRLPFHAKSGAFPLRAPVRMPCIAASD